MDHQDFLRHVEAERDRALTLVAACDAVLQAYGAAMQPTLPLPPVVAAPPKPGRAAKAPTPRPAVSLKPRVGPAKDPESKVGQYRDAILKALAHYTLAPHHAADSTVLRREVAKACKVDPNKDRSFVGDVSNALRGLRRDGKVERSGTMWALTTTPTAPD